jgi:isoleucyl-tRNA synthetase
MSKEEIPVEKSEAAKREEATLAFWKEARIFEKSLEKPAPLGEFTFYEGPPTANGKPGIHHLESRAFKDAIPRYKTMRGYKVARRAGWDTHGLPVELEVEKQLSFTGKKDIEEYGIAAFNKKCRESVFSYIDEWSRFTTRIGYWVDQSKAYFTFDASYMEVLWSVFARVASDGRLYKDYKVVPWCPRCGTALSAHELAQGYQDVKDLTITAKFELVDEPGTFLIAWTTTPWTLPGNVGLAVGEKIAYGVYEKEGEKVILAEVRAGEVLDESWKKVGTLPGAEMVGKSYKPLYSFAHQLAPDSEKAKFDNAFKIYPAHFVTTEDGTGIVHTAVMYGQEDFELGNAVGLPKVHLVNPEGKFIAGTGFLENRLVADEEVAVDVVKDLASRGLLFAKGKYEHAYPFCWRCKTRLIYYARDSWYIRMQDLRGKLVEENNKIHWVPEHTREGRMGEWLANAKDWAISRERYWGTPLPVWRSEDGKEQIVIGSVEELKARTKKSGNKYYVMRHGEGEQNVKGLVSSSVDDGYALTEKGRAQVLVKAQELKTQGITKIYASPFLRTRQTAEIVADAIELPRTAIQYEPKLEELHFGDLSGRPFGEFDTYASAHMPSYADSLPNGESYLEAKRRFGAFLYDLETTLHDQTILIVSHGVALETLLAVSEGADNSRSKEILDTLNPNVADVCALHFIPLPHNEDYELDLHRPYIDKVILVSDTGTELRRVKEVMDVWFDSGAMPFAQSANERKGESLDTYLENVVYPADYISEAIDQTRGWFYTLLAVGTLMKRAAPYKNVICLGHLLDANGQKMSKSKGNVVEPFAEIERWGVDALRFWMYSVNQAGDSKNFDEKTVKESSRALNWLEQSAKFYELFKDVPVKRTIEQPIDMWMRVRTNATVHEVTTALDAYELYDATRAFSNFLGDLSQWYVRRIRDRAREGDVVARETLRETLRVSALLLAPFAPFLAEDIFKTVKNAEDPESVHLAKWPHPTAPAGGEGELIKEMTQVRELASQALQLRQKENIKVRQPLASLSIPGELSPGLAQILAEEVNVKKILTGASALALDTVLTPELIAEGDARAFARAVAEARKALGLAPQDKAEAVKVEGGPYSAELSTGLVQFRLDVDAT